MLAPPRRPGPAGINEFPKAPTRAWIAVPAEFPADGTRLWRPEVGGAAVQLELYPLEDGSIRLFMTWP